MPTCSSDRETSRDWLLGRVKAVVSKKLRVDPAPLAPDLSLSLDLGADDLDVVEVAMALERELEIRIPNEILPELQTLGDFAHYLSELSNWGT